MDTNSVIMQTEPIIPEKKSGDLHASPRSFHSKRPLLLQKEAVVFIRSPVVRKKAKEFWMFFPWKHMEKEAIRISVK